MRKQAVWALFLSMCFAAPAMAGEMETEPDMIIEEYGFEYEPESEVWEETGAEDIFIDLSDVSDNIVVPQVATAAEGSVTLSPDNFPDDVFREYLRKFDLDGSDSLDSDEIASVKEIDVEAKNVHDLSGLSYFTELETLMCDNNGLEELDVGSNTKLKTLTCSYNNLTSLDVYKNRKLMSLVCSNNRITTIDVTNAPNLQDLRVANNELEALNVSNNPKLTWLDCSGNHLSALDVSGHAYLQYLHCYDNQLTSLDVTGDKELQWLECYNNHLSVLDVSDALNVKNNSDSAFNLLNCADNQLTSIDITNKAYFKGLVCSNNCLTGLDFTGTPDLRQLDCSDNQIEALDVSCNTKLETLDCSGNRILSLDLRNQFISATSVLPDCSCQQFTIILSETDTGYQADLSPFVGSGTLLRLTEEALPGSDAYKFGNVALLTQEGDLEGNILSFDLRQVPEVIQFACGTGYEKKPGDKDVFLGMELHCHIHTYADQPVEVQEPGCLEAGSKTLVCPECGFEKTVSIPAAGHNYVKDPASREATCTEDGLDKVTCTGCGDSKETVIPATGHNYIQDPKSKAATCTEDGLDKITCSVCGNSKETELPALGHDYKVIKETKADCENTGIKLEECTRCKDTMEYLLMTSGHAFRIIGKVSATCTKNGYIKGECLICGAIKTTELRAAGHKFVKKEKAATYTSSGSRWEECKVCSKIRNRETIPRIGEPAEYINGTKKLALAPGKTLNLKGYIPAGSKNVTYKSSNKKVATVSKKGVVKAKKNGTVKITIKSGKKKYTISIKVAKPAAKIKNVPSKKTLKKGKSFQLKPKVSGKVTYKSSNKKVATVTSKGKVKAKKRGTAEITVTAGGQKKVCKVTVK